MVQDDAARAAAGEAGLPWFRGGLVEHSGGGLPIMSARHSPWGRRHAQAMIDGDLRDHMWAFIMQGEDLPVRDQHGRPQPLDP